MPDAPLTQGKTPLVRFDERRGGCGEPSVARPTPTAPEFVETEETADAL